MLWLYSHAHPFSKCYNKVIKSRGKPSKLFNQSHKAHITPYHATGYYVLWGGHTDTHIHMRIPTCKPKQFQETRCALPSTAHMWFKNLVHGVLIFLRILQILDLMSIIGVPNLKEITTCEGYFM